MNDLINYNKEIVELDNQDIPFDYLRPHEARQLIEATTNNSKAYITAKQARKIPDWI